MGYEQFLSSKQKSLTPSGWDGLIRLIAADIADLQSGKTAQEILADSLLARGLQVIEDLIEPVAQDAQGRVDDINALITDGTDQVNEAVLNANQAAAGIAALLSQLQSAGLSADLVIESATRIFLTPTLKATYDAYAAAIASKASSADLAAAIANLVDSSPELLNTLNEFAAAIGNDPNFAATNATALGNRLRVDINNQALSGTQKANALANLGIIAGTFAAGDDSRIVGALQKAGNQTLTGGFDATPYNLGNMASFTINPKLGQLQYGANVGALTITAPTSDCEVDMRITNSATAGAITFSGMTGYPSSGALDTVSGNIFDVLIRRINGVTKYLVVGHQA